MDNRTKVARAKKEALRKAHTIQQCFGTPDGQETLKLLKDEFSVTSRLTCENPHATVIRAAHMEIFFYIDIISEKDLSDAE